MGACDPVISGLILIFTGLISLAGVDSPISVGKPCRVWFLGIPLLTIPGIIMLALTYLGYLPIT